MKLVRFGPHVVDNENKTPASRSGLPNDCPGKFPSPWTPKVVKYTERKDQLDVTSEIKSVASIRKNDTSQANDAVDAKKTQPRKPLAKDDADLTIDFLHPRSESGKYWKEQYLLYSNKSEEEVKKLIAKTKVARDYAKKMDDELSELRRRFETERKRQQSRERALEKQIKDLREQLRLLSAENRRTAAAVAATTIAEPPLTQRGVEGHQHDLERDSLKTAPEAQQVTSEADSGWPEAAGIECDTSYIPQSTMSNSTRAGTRSTRTRPTKKLREKSTNQLSGVQRKSNSAIEPKHEQSSTPADSPANGTSSLPLKPRSSNITVKSSQRIKAKLVSDGASHNQSVEVGDTPNLDSKFGSSAPSETLTTQTDQPITSALIQKHNVIKGPGIPADRVTAAAERIAARKKLRGLHEETK